MREERPRAVAAGLTPPRTVSIMASSVSGDEPAGPRASQPADRPISLRRWLMYVVVWVLGQLGSHVAEARLRRMLGDLPASAAPADFGETVSTLARLTEDEPAGPVSSTPEQVPTPREPVAAESARAIGDSADAASDARVESFLLAESEERQRVLAEIDQSARRLESYSLFTVRVRLIAGALALALAVVGVVLLISGHLTPGVASAAVAMLSGAGTVGLKRINDEVRSRLETLGSQREAQAEQLRALSALKAVRDPALRRQGVLTLATRFGAEPKSE
jgi:hypothetical protein